MNVASCPSMTLNDVVELYCIKKFNDKRKYFKEYSIIGQEIWKELFMGPLWATKNVYLELKSGQPFNYVELPSNCLRFLSAGVKSHCDQLKPLFYNQDLDVISKPTIKPCGCNACDCASDGLCSSTNSLTVIPKEVIIDNVTYTEYTWVSVCPNGDIMEYRTIPTKRYTFNPGSYDRSYDVSYDIGTSDEEVVTYTLTRKLCKLEIADCGCPKQTPENCTLFFNNCGCFLNPLTPLARQCNTYWKDCNSPWAGECKLSECGTKLFVRRIVDISKNHQILITYQTNGIDIDGEVMVPNYCNRAIHAGLEYERIWSKDIFPPSVKDRAYYEKMKEFENVIKFLNPIYIEVLENTSNVAHW